MDKSWETPTNSGKRIQISKCLKVLAPWFGPIFRHPETPPAIFGAPFVLPRYQATDSSTIISVVTALPSSAQPPAMPLPSRGGGSARANGGRGGAALRCGATVAGHGRPDPRRPLVNRHRPLHFNRVRWRCLGDPQFTWRTSRTRIEVRAEQISGTRVRA